jgi:hypothetical protein
MEAAVVVALISAVSALLLGAWNAVWTSKQNDQNRDAQKRLADDQRAANKELELLKHGLEREAKEEERRMDAREQLMRYRLPILDAASDLGHRIDNIVHGQFLAYLSDDHPRRDTAVLSTVYRLARYFGTLEILYSRVNHLRFERDEDTRAVAEALAAIGRTFASDRYDREKPDELFHTSRFMVWREEQRAMGEVIRRNGEGDVDDCVGFATFAANAQKRDAGWFANFVRDLESGGAEGSERLRVLQSHLANLVRLLDEEGRYTGTGNEPSWMERARSLQAGPH